jgi:hypothetical protein
MEHAVESTHQIPTFAVMDARFAGSAGTDEGVP